MDFGPEAETTCSWSLKPSWALRGVLAEILGSCRVSNGRAERTKPGFRLQALRQGQLAISR